MNTQDGISDTKLTDTTEISQKESLPTIKVNRPLMAVADTSLKSLTSTLEGSLSPEAQVEKAFPSPFIHIKDISIDDLNITPINTGFKFFDSVLLLKQRRPEIVVVGARPGHGKSALLLQIAANVAKHSPVLVFSFEMDERDIKARLAAPRVQITLDRLVRGKDSHYKRHLADAEFASMDLHLCTNGKRSISYVCQTVCDFARKTKPELIVIDYLQKMTGPDESRGKVYEVGDILATLKELAKKMQCPILMGAQLNREVEKRGKSIEMKKGIGDYKPMVSDLKDSGAIDADADVVLLLSRQQEYDQTRQGEADIIVAKNRGGKPGSEIFRFNGGYCSFYERDDYTPEDRNF